ncbi:MAG TPA: asparaginase [Candidatus Baltobacteraceae bacterium]|jgi:L-asparaginase II
MRETDLRGEPFVEVTRGGLSESVHAVAACAVDAEGKVVFALGDVGASTYLRSAAKPFIAAASIVENVHERFGLDAPEIAVMAGSHSGEPYHVAAVRSILRKIGMDESALQCGAHEPYNADAARDLRRSGGKPSAVHNNCSGKHAGILALCKAIGADCATYLEPDNPAQKRILSLCAAMSSVSLEALHIGIDGCGVPVYALPLERAAMSYMRLATLRGMDGESAAALGVVRAAMIAYPEYVCGTGEFDAALMRAGEGAIACKGGAEGIHATALLDRGVGLVLKIVDGAERAHAPAAISALRRMGMLSERQCASLRAFARPTVYNWAARPVGEIRSL